MSDPRTSTFVDVIDLSPTDQPNRFAGPPAPERGGRVYGGQLLAQAVAGAYRTIEDDRRIHSLHAYFLRPGDISAPTYWDVDIVRDGRSFATRSVTGHQHDREVFHLIASFHVPEAGFDYQPVPDYDVGGLPTAEEVDMSYVDFSHQQPGFDPESWFGQDRPMEIRYLNPPAPGIATDAPQLTWTRIDGPLPEAPHLHDAGLAYLADSTLVDHVLLPHGERWHDPRLTGASLDHAMWFHRTVSADEWLLYDQRVAATGGARGLATGRFYTAAGELVATCVQEGLIRWSP
ncbi:MAG: acyl-CoA thioesterase [Acidimicrobiales bacterium]